MDIENIKNIIAQGEGTFVEFKRSYNRQVIESIVAFANKKGGIVLIGITDSGEITEIELNEESLINWQNEIKLKTEPSIQPDIKKVLIDNKVIVIIKVPEYPVKPVSFQGRYYIRRNNSNHLLSVSEINDVYLQSIQTSWDSYPYADVTYRDLNERDIITFIENVNIGNRFQLLVFQLNA